MVGIGGRGRDGRAGRFTGRAGHAKLNGAAAVLVHRKSSRPESHMFVGHVAVAMLAARARPRTPFVWWMAAANLVDLVWPLLLLAGVETVRVAPGITAFTPLAFESYPWTHSLLAGVLWGAALAGFARAAGVERAALPLLAATVVSHWLLDWLTHVPDLPLAPWLAGRYGLGLWRSVPGTLVVEGALWLAAITLFLRARRPTSWAGHLAIWSFVLLNTFIWASGPFTPPPPDARSLAWFALVGWIVVPWAWWIDRSSSGRGPLGHG